MKSIIALLFLLAVSQLPAKERDTVAGKTFLTGPGNLKYVHVVYRFIDPNKVKWPSIGWGRAEPDTSITFAPSGLPTGSLQMNSEGLNLLRGDTSRFVLGNVIHDHEAPPISLKVTSFGNTLQQKQSTGKTSKRAYTEFRGELVVGQHKTPVVGEVTWGMGKVDSAKKMRMHFRTEVDGAAIGAPELKKVLVVFDLSGYEQGTRNNKK